MKQTAVDILYKFLYEMESFEGFDPYNFNQKKVFEKAKEIEKEQIIKAFNQSWHDRMNPYKTADKYYNETFK
jgi:hypothetical protein